MTVIWVIVSNAFGCGLFSEHGTMFCHCNNCCFDVEVIAFGRDDIQSHFSELHFLRLAGVPNPNGYSIVEESKSGHHSLVYSFVFGGVCLLIFTHP